MSTDRSPLFGPGAGCLRTIPASPRIAGSYRFHRQQLDTQVTQLVEQPVQVSLVADLAYENGLTGAGYRRHPVEGRGEVVAQPPS